jgi:N6-L-threonylcarbamoyladenine synthase
MANIVPVVKSALEDASVHQKDLTAIGFTRGPGLLGSLIVGVSFAKSLALGLGIPLIEVHHMNAHILAHFAEDPKPQFPFLCLTVSGGHTQIVQVDDFLDMVILGQTIDDAAGEAFDKTGKMLGLSYPAGPIIDKYAQDGDAIYTFTEPKVDGLNFSFSGLKTSILHFLQKEMKKDDQFITNNMNNICASVQARIVSILLNKLTLAAKKTGITQLAIAGGVSANSGLRNGLINLCNENGWRHFIPAFQYCTDNAGMIAVSAYQKYLAGKFVGQEVTPKARMEM